LLLVYHQRVRLLSSFLLFRYSWLKLALMGASPAGVNFRTVVVLSSAKDLSLGRAQILRSREDACPERSEGMTVAGGPQA
jgi:hypothetical protein